MLNYSWRIEIRSPPVADDVFDFPFVRSSVGSTESGVQQTLHSFDFVFSMGQLSSWSVSNKIMKKEEERLTI